MIWAACAQDASLLLWFAPPSREGHACGQGSDPESQQRKLPPSWLQPNIDESPSACKVFETKDGRAVTKKLPDSGPVVRKRFVVRWWTVIGHYSENFSFAIVPSNSGFALPTPEPLALRRHPLCLRRARA